MGYSVMQLHSGGYIDFLKPTPDQIHVNDIAHGLSHICRFGGQTSAFYSVAQHSVMVAELVPMPFKKAALFHDAAEAYLGDIITPLKSLLPEYRVIEDRLQQVICERFNISVEKNSVIKDADLIALVTEKRDLMFKNKEDAYFWPELQAIPSHPVIIRPQPPHIAKQQFLIAYKRILHDEMLHAAQSMSTPA